MDAILRWHSDPLVFPEDMYYRDTYSRMTTHLMLIYSNLLYSRCILPLAPLPSSARHQLFGLSPPRTGTDLTEREGMRLGPKVLLPDDRLPRCARSPATGSVHGSSRVCMGLGFLIAYNNTLSPAYAQDISIRRLSSRSCLNKASLQLSVTLCVLNV